MTWDCVDCRTYTTALRLRTVAGSTSELVIFKLLDIEADRLRQDLSQYQDDFVSLGGTHSFRSFGVEQQVHLPSRDRRRQLGTVMVILPKDFGIAPGVCGVGGAHQKPLQFDKCREIHARRAL